MFSDNITQSNNSEPEKNVQYKLIDKNWDNTILDKLYTNQGRKELLEDGIRKNKTDNQGIGPYSNDGNYPFEKKYTQFSDEDIANTEAAILGTIRTAADEKHYTLTDDQAKQVLYKAVADRPDNPLESDNLANAIAYVLGGGADSTGDPVLQAGVSELEKTLFANEVNAKTLDQIYAACAEQLKANSPAVDDATAALIITYACENYDTNADFNTNLSNAAGTLTKAVSVNTDVETVRSGAGNQVITALLTSMVQADSGTMNALNALLSTLNQVKSFVAGVKTYTDGVSAACSGADQLKKGTDTLKDGTTQLQNGAKELYDGMVKYNQAGISKITESSDIKNIDKLGGMVKAIKDKSSQYASYSGVSDDMESRTIYIYKVADAETSLAPTASAETVKEDSSSSDESEGFWGWFTGLFK
ncbi:MAG: hypothetical protein EOM64_09075 [Erysipelotrichia bacterium]|nr:hypothetical protein [Erysipelotrichia bacterium]